MAITVPTSWQQPTALTRGEPLAAAQAGALVENDALARSRLRVLATFGRQSYTTTSGSLVTVVDDWPVEASESNSGSVTVHVYGQNVDARTELTDGTTTINNVTTVAGGPGYNSGSLTTTSLTGTAWRMTVKIRVPASGTATLDDVLVVEDLHDASSIA